jgi:hypothetical protein
MPCISPYPAEIMVVAAATCFLLQGAALLQWETFLATKGGW